MGLKILRDHMPSANLVAMYSLDGNPSNNWNFFAKDFTNHVSKSYSPAGLALALYQSHATDLLWQTGLSDWALEKTRGSLLQGSHFPFQLRFEPHKDIKNLISESLGYGYSSDRYMSYVDQLSQMPANSNLFNIYAFDKPV